MNSDYEQIITGRKFSLFADDIQNNEYELLSKVKKSRIAIIGAAGSIGGSVVKTLLKYKPKEIILIDLSENNLVELIRDLRSSKSIKLPEKITSMPIGLGSVEFNRFFKENNQFDYILNLAALKHVRSEKNIYCLIRMLDTNVLFFYDFLEKLPYSLKKVFSVSSDKAANPANIMGASKMAMEKSLMLLSEKHSFSSARFANVAFSDGSLPYGFLNRIKKEQPIPAPRDIKRYFISHREAGELCVLSCFTGNNGDILFPKMNGRKFLNTFKDIADRLLEFHGYTPYECASESEAKKRSKELIAKKRWPCYYFNTDTTGEKSCEEFYSSCEIPNLDIYKNIGTITHLHNKAKENLILGFLTFIREAKLNTSIRKRDCIRELNKIVPSLNHIEAGKNLDEKM